MANTNKIISFADEATPYELDAREPALEPVLKTENLWKVYRSGKVDVAALRGVDVRVLPGEFVCIMGPSGCGKSTLLHVIGGLARATRGRVLLDGNDLGAMNDGERTLLRRHKVEDHTHAHRGKGIDDFSPGLERRAAFIDAHLEHGSRRERVQGIDKAAIRPQICGARSHPRLRFRLKH